MQVTKQTFGWLCNASYRKNFI